MGRRAVPSLVLREYWDAWSVMELVAWLQDHAHMSLDMIKATMRTKAVPPERVNEAIRLYWSNE